MRTPSSQLLLALSAALLSACVPAPALDAGLDTGPADAGPSDASGIGDSSPADAGASDAEGGAVACLADGDCTDPTMARCDAGACVPCTDAGQCVGIADRGLCEIGACVECTAADRGACGLNVCDATTNLCTTRLATSADLCQDCVADAECQDGQLCVPMTFMSTAVGSFCLWRENAPMPPGPGDLCGNVRPYVLPEEVTSVDSVTTNVCTLARTTCAALNQYSMLVCTTPFVSDDECGVTGLDDGLCRFSAGLGNFCTIPCASNFDCVSLSTCNTAAAPRYCNF